jgi:hypothetical protein
LSATPLVCADRSGFLFAHACDRPAAGACVVCGKPICLEHTRMAAAGPTCITCLRSDWRDDDSGFRTGRSGDRGQRAERDEPGVEREGRSGGGGASGEFPEGSRPADDPFFYPGVDRGAYYDADDFRAFDAAPAAAEEEAGSAGPDTDTGAS